jgi:predicted nucleotidyltransferase
MDNHLARRLKAALEDHAEIAAAYLFGSHAGEHPRRTSDVDIAVIFAAGVEAETRFRKRCILSARLAAAAGAASADVVDLESASPLLAHEVLRSGRLLLSRDEARRVRVVARQTMRYIDSRPMRRVLDEATFRRLREGSLGRLA